MLKGSISVFIVAIKSFNLIICSVLDSVSTGLLGLLSLLLIEPRFLSKI
jgi:hypothetical protein